MEYKKTLYKYKKMVSRVDFCLKKTFCLINAVATKEATKNKQEFKNKIKRNLYILCGREISENVIKRFRD